MLARKQVSINQQIAWTRATLRRAAYTLYAVSFAFLAGVYGVAQVQPLATSPSGIQTSFEVRFKEFDNVYLNIEPGAPLVKGTKLLIKRQSGSHGESVVAELKVRFVSSTSAVCEVLRMEGELQQGDRAYLTPEEIAALSRQQTVSPVRPQAQTATSVQLFPTVAKALPEAVTKPRPPAQAVANMTPAPSKAPPPLQQSNASVVVSSSAVRNIQTQASEIRKDTAAAASPSPQAPLTVSSGSNVSKPGVAAALNVSAANAQPSIVAQPKQVATSAQATPSMRSPLAAVSGQGQPQPGKGVAAASVVSISQNISPTAVTKANASTPSVNDGSSVAKAASRAGEKQSSVQSDSITGTPESAQGIPPASLPDVQTIFKIKFVAQDTVYLSAGTATGLTSGMKLTVKHSELDINEKGTLAKASQAPTIAELEVISVASSSAVCTVQKKTGDIQPGDLAFMDQTAAEALAEKRSLSANRKYPQVVSFNGGDPLEEEVREQVPKPPLPEVNRIRGRFGFDYGDIRSTGSVSSNNSQYGIVVRTDFTRIGGSYWNLSGYWRGRLNNTSNAEQPTLQDLINRTYHLNLSYSNPMSPWVAGFGRLYLPWATSLETIDGGYFGRKAGKHVLLGLFAGSTPDPTSWDYNPDRRLGGMFLNLEGGSFDSLRFTSTTGIALSTLKWQVDRPFVFFESGLYFKRYISLYDSTQADNQRPVPGMPAPGPALSRNFLTLRIQPHERISFDVNHNYFRDVPTFSTALIATGLLDKYLFQGLSTGARVEPIRHITFYASVGKSSRTGDTSSSWNEMYGVTLAQIPKTGLRVDARTSRFDSSFGSGKYRSLSLSRNFTEALRLEGQVGEQFLNSQLSSQGYSRFVNATLESNLGKNYFIQGAYTVQRGGSFNYNQWTITFGYRFDNRSLGVGF